jgi:hypothetical protein
VGRAAPGSQPRTCFACQARGVRFVSPPEASVARPGCCSSPVTGRTRHCSGYTHFFLGVVVGVGGCSLSLPGSLTPSSSHSMPSRALLDRSLTRICACGLACRRAWPMSSWSRRRRRAGPSPCSTASCCWGSRSWWAGCGVGRDAGEWAGERTGALRGQRAGKGLPCHHVQTRAKRVQQQAGCLARGEASCVPWQGSFLAAQHSLSANGWPSHPCQLGRLSHQA